MLFVVLKRDLQYAISVLRDDRGKRNHSGSFMRLEARHDFLSLSVWDASAQISATVYEAGVVFLRTRVLRQLLPTIKHSKYLEIKVTDLGLSLDQVFISLPSGDKLFYDDPETAPAIHPADRLAKGSSIVPTHRQLSLWDDKPSKP